MSHLQLSSEMLIFMHLMYPLYHLFSKLKRSKLQLVSLILQKENTITVTVYHYLN